MKRLQAVFSGRVQGVGFRATVDKIARKFPVTGWVRNLPNGTVEMAAEGEVHVLEAFLKSIQSSHLLIFIRKVETQWLEAQGEFKEFIIRG